MLKALLKIQQINELAFGCDINKEKSQLRSCGRKHTEYKLGNYTCHLKLDTDGGLYYDKVNISVCIATGWFKVGEFRTRKTAAGLIAIPMQKICLYYWEKPRKTSVRTSAETAENRPRYSISQYKSKTSSPYLLFL
jgi:hypothetical protein